MKKRIWSVILSVALSFSAITAAALTFPEDNVNAEVTSENQSAVQAIRDSLTLTWSDEFDGDKIDKNNWIYEGSRNHRNGEAQAYADSDEDGNAWVEDGKLVIEARREDKTVVEYNGTKRTYPYTSACLRTSMYDNTKRSFKYGMLEARIKVPDSLGTWPAFWTCGVARDGTQVYWPEGGEIDIMERFGESRTSITEYQSKFHHYESDGRTKTADLGATAQYELKGRTFGMDYHTYGVFYTESMLMYYFDDCITAIYDISGDDYYALSSYPQFFLLNIAIPGAAWDESVRENYLPEGFDRMYVDYVRVYQAEDNDYSHIRVLSAANDTEYDKNTMKTMSWEPALDLANLCVPRDVESAMFTTKDKIGEGKYDAYITAVSDPYTTGKYKYSLNGGDYTSEVDYTSGEKYVNSSGEEAVSPCDKSVYIGTAEIVNGAHNLSVDVEKTADGNNKYGNLLRTVVLIGNSKNVATVTVGDEDVTTQTQTVSTTAEPTETETTVTSATETTAPPEPTAPTATEPQFTYGDANKDGKVTATDVLLVRKNIAGQSIALDFKAADVNNDGKLTATDVLLIRKFIAGQPIVLGK